MRALVCRAFGEPTSVRVEQRESAALDPARVRVGVTAAGVNYVDGLFVQGRYQIRPDLPFTPGSELAGVVTEVGAQVEGWSPGDRVLASVGLGAFASEADLSPAQLVAVPPNVSDTQAATLGQSYATAWFSLTRRTTVVGGEWILVLGAAGGVGLACLDVARALGLNTIAAASTREKLELCIRRGAHEVIDYSTEDLKARARELSGGGVDLAVDPVGGAHTEAALRALGDMGRLIVIGFAGGEIAAIPANQILLRNRSVLGVDWGIWALTDPAANAELMGEVLAATAEGTLEPVEPETRPLEEAGVAMQDLLERRVSGKLCLVP
ncbi:MAG: NADPH:quinone oxidoreductase family protein [Microthrixaceae bacterium]